MLNSPATILLCTHWWLGLNLLVWPHIATSPVFFCNSTIACASCNESANGISTCTCLPAFRQASACCVCIWVGVHRITASTSFSARLSARSVETWAMPYLAATSLVGSSLRPTSDTTSMPSIFLMPSRCLMPNAPAPASATLIALAISVVLQDQMADRGVACGHVIEAVQDLRLLAAIDVAHGAARDQPHHEFDTLAAGFADVIDMWHLGETVRIGDQAVEEVGVELLVDQPRARPLKLVAHAAGTPDLHIERFFVGFDSLADRFAEHEAAPARWRRVLHHIDRERDHRARPCFRLAAHQAERHRQTVVDVHLVDDGQIKIVLDHRLRDMGGELRVTDHLGYRARAPALVGHRELRRGADREGRDEIQAERVGVIVIDQKDDVRLLVLQPLLGEFVALEDRLPIGLGGLAEIDRRADRRHMGSVDACGDTGHHFFSPMWRLPSMVRPPFTIISRYCSSLMPVMLPAIC